MKYIKLFENYIKESIVYFSPEFRKILKRVNNDISKELLNVELTIVKPDITFIDVSPKEGYITYGRMVDAKKLVDNIDLETMGKSASDLLYGEDIAGEVEGGGVYTNKSRSEIRLSRFINNLFPKRWTPDEIHDFVTRYNAKVKSEWNFDIVSGEDIYFWYNYENYSELSGTLGGSCMKNKGNIFDIYTRNPDVCRLLILKNDAGDKIMGRALVWKPENDEGFTFFMDRVYTINGINIQIFHDFAESQGWARKVYNDYNSCGRVHYKDDLQISMSIELKNMKYSSFPYMDTFKRYSPYVHILYNDEDEDNDGEYILSSTDGGYDVIGTNTVYSSYYDCQIDEDSAIYSDPLSTYIYDNNCVYVALGVSRNRGYYPRDHEDIFHLEYRDSYAHTDDCVFSDYDGKHCFEDDMIEAIVDIDEDGNFETQEVCGYNNSKFPFINKRTDWNKYLDIEDVDRILMDLVMKDFKGDYILKRFAKSAAKSNIDRLFLTDFDSDLLGIPTSKDHYYIFDGFTYYTDLLPHKDKLLDALITDPITNESKLKEFNFYFNKIEKNEKK